MLDVETDKKRSLSKTYQNAPKIISQKCGDLDLIDIWRTGMRMIIDIHGTDENQKYTAGLISF